MDGEPAAAANIARIIGRLPGYRAESVTLLGSGADNLAYEVNGELIVRFSREPDPVRRAERIQRESDLLGYLASISPVAIPLPLVTAADAGCLVYRKLPGTILLDMPQTSDAVAPLIAAQLADLLTVLHAVPINEVSRFVDEDIDSLEQWRDEAAELLGQVAANLPGGFLNRIEAFFAEPLPTSRCTAVLSHNDLGIEHVLVDPDAGAVTGVIDWSDAAIVDPAYDIGLLYRDLGPAVLQELLGRYRNANDDLDAIGRRAVFYARCSVLEDLDYGVRVSDPRYLDKACAALTWLFAHS
jgi:aminoglycoside phosphotransferase (APT) family kinase protein